VRSWDCCWTGFWKTSASLNTSKSILDSAGRARLLQAALGLTRGEAEKRFAKIIVKDERLSVEDVNEVFAEKQQIIRKSGLLKYSEYRRILAKLAGWMC